MMQRNLSAHSKHDNGSTLPITIQKKHSCEEEVEDIEKNNHSFAERSTISNNNRNGSRLTMRRKFLITLMVLLVTFLLGVYWFVFVFNAPEIVLKMQGPVFNNKNEDSLYLIKTRTNPPFMMMTLSPKTDIWISKQLLERGLWESAITSSFEEVLGNLFKNPSFDCNMIDVGGNLGFFSLLSAAFGCNVVTYEVQPEMVEKIRTSAAINGFKNVEVKNNAVSSVSGKPFSIGFGDTSNKGSAYAYDNSKTTDVSLSEVRVVSASLDDEFKEVIAKKKRITILKVDVEGNEGSVLNGAKELLPLVDNTVIEINQYTLGVLKPLLSAGFNKLIVLEEPKMVWSYFVKKSPSKIFINPTYQEVALYIINTYGKSDIWFSRI